MIICALGGDIRLTEAAKRFADDNCVYCYGWDKYTEIYPKIHCCDTLQQAVERADIILLGLPCQTDGKTLLCPLSETVIEISDIIAYAPAHAVVCGGLLPKSITDAFARNIDYFKDEFLQICNAVPTAEGAIMIAMQSTPFTVDGANITVLGSGRITKALVPRLKALNAEITVIARKKTDRAYWETFGVTAEDFNGMQSALLESDIVFNTVPSLVLDKPQIDLISKNALIIDLASKPGGVNFDYIKLTGKQAIHALSLPGKVAPVTAGKIIHNTVTTLLNEKGVMI